MSLKDLREKFKYDEEYIYYGLMLDLSYYLKQFMIEKGLNKKQLAEKMGVSPAYVTKIFSGENISLKTVAKILSALEVNPSIKIIDSEKVEYKKTPNTELFNFIEKEGKEVESKTFPTAA